MKPELVHAVRLCRGCDQGSCWKGRPAPSIDDVAKQHCNVANRHAWQQTIVASKTAVPTAIYIAAIEVFNSNPVLCHVYGTIILQFYLLPNAQHYLLAPSS